MDDQPGKKGSLKNIFRIRTVSGQTRSTFGRLASAAFSSFAVKVARN